jgi:hypothetical protein
MNFSEVNVDDPRWTDRERLVFNHLFRTRQRYIDENRRLEAHGMSKAIFVMANVLEAYINAQVTSSDLFQTKL